MSNAITVNRTKDTNALSWKFRFLNYYFSVCSTLTFASLPVEYMVRPTQDRSCATLRNKGNGNSCQSMKKQHAWYIERHRSAPIVGKHSASLRNPQRSKVGINRERRTSSETQLFHLHLAESTAHDSVAAAGFSAGLGLSAAPSVDLFWKLPRPPPRPPRPPRSSPRPRPRPPRKPPRPRPASLSLVLL